MHKSSDVSINGVSESTIVHALKLAVVALNFPDFATVTWGYKKKHIFSLSVSKRRNRSYIYISIFTLVQFVLVPQSRVRLFPYELYQTYLAEGVGVGKQQKQIGGNVWMVICVCVCVKQYPEALSVLTLIQCPLLLYPQIHTF